MKRILLLLMALAVILTSGITVYAQSGDDLSSHFNSEMPKYGSQGNPPEELAGLHDDRVMKGYWDNIPIVDNSYKVHDFAGALTQAETDDLETKARELVKQYNLDVVIVITANTLGRNEVSFAQDFFEANAFGTTKKTSGVIFVLDYEHRKINVSTHGRAIKLFNDRDISVVLDAIGESLNRDITDAYGASQGYLGAVEYKFADQYKEIGIKALISAAIGAVLAGAILALMRFAHNSSLPDAIPAQHYIPNNQINLQNSGDRFVNTYTTRTPRPKNTSSGGGGGGGGTSIGSSSSGSSFGGGSRSF